jgi:probable rRNA maturation factor
MNVSIDFAVESPRWSGLAAAQASIRSAIEAAVADAGPSAAEIGVVLADDEHIRGLNRHWLGKDAPTNVLSFPAPDRPQDGPRFLGDIVFALETIEREADAERKPLNDHLAHLAVHGVLHLLGFDHENEEDAETMEHRERKILAGLGVPDPYAPAGRRRVPA